MREAKLRRFHEKEQNIAQGAFLACMTTAILLYDFLLPLKVISDSMSPTLKTGDQVLVNEMAYGLRLPFKRSPIIHRRPARGDICILRTSPDFRSAPGWRTEEPRFYVKRIVGLPGDILMIKKGRIFINGHGLREPYVSAEMRGDDSIKSLRIPAGFCFLAGDARKISADSRGLGLALLRNVLGKVEAIYWPPSRLRWVR